MDAVGATECVLTILVVLFVCNFVVRVVRRPTYPAEPEPDDFAGVPARLRPRPKSGAGAIALEEPDEDETDRNGETFR